MIKALKVIKSTITVTLAICCIMSDSTVIKILFATSAYLDSLIKIVQPTNHDSQS